MEDYHQKKNGRRPPKKMEDDLQKNGRGPQKKMENNQKNIKKWKTTSKNKTKKPKKNNNLFSIPLKFRGKPFLGLAQLSKILIQY
jgi:hypothetical protein